ncbi:cellulose biosynthesis cyclic di-GMP-binding regulatory protein BcsB [Pusillimonas sp. ANT_WB101]|uniref:cellulose biosynthesis cyclic di-GMP-binding regulatory protein BcsB n=1 Tax=Pusillimonas sp. ANT_WB101 TaxID=2597356 RepID=UPI001CAA8A0A|nr:cellulose biosynthesis cyclic di-GMP-binding regulatory protein BcsB [Pusillimonas sp. ANT_WB101]
MTVCAVPSRCGISLIRIVLLAFSLAAGAHAQSLPQMDGTPAPADAVEHVPETETAKALVPQYKLTLEQLGARYPFYLRGVDGSDSVPFNIRADEVVTGAKVNLTYSYSPALLSDLSHINVLINDEVVTTLMVPRDEAGKTLQRSVELPPSLITEFNHLRLQLIGHYTLECEDPVHSSLWASVSNKSQLDLAVQRISLPEELSILPLPFFDYRDTRPLDLPFIFSNDKDAAVMESAGMVASWFGALAGYRGASFPANFDGGYPRQGNGIVFVKGNTASFGHMDAFTGPTLAVAANPNDEFGKLLLIAGRDDEEIKRAAQALVTGGATLSGQVAVITELDQLSARKPYDAPNWLQTDRPIKFGELVSEQALSATGYNNAPVRLPLRLPPDLFGWRAKPVPVDLRYRYTPQPGQVNSALLISAKEQFLKSFPLRSADQINDKNWLKSLSSDEMLPIHAKVEIPLERLMSRSELEFKFMYDYVKEGACRDIIIDNVRGRIDPDSTLDLTHYPHFIPLPDLAAFGNSGFPFTRLADLSQTAVVLSDQPFTEDVTTYLTLMGRFGMSTGYPATHVTVAYGQSKLEQADKDLIIIASGEQGWLSDWAKYMPASLSGQNKRFGTSDLTQKIRDWITPDPRESQRPVRTDLAYTSTGANALFAGFESPVTAGRSVVLIASGEPQGQAYAVNALLGKKGYEQGLQGSLVVVREQRLNPLIAEYTYSNGRLGLWRQIEWTVAQYWPNLPAFNRVLGSVAVLLLLISAFIGWRLWRKPRRV